MHKSWWMDLLNLGSSLPVAKPGNVELLGYPMVHGPVYCDGYLPHWYVKVSRLPSSDERKKALIPSSPFLRSSGKEYKLFHARLRVPRW